MWLAFFANRLTQEKKSSTLRDVYYSSQAFAVDFKDQSESDNIIVDLEAVLTKPREDFHVFPEERSSVFGDLDIEYTVPGYEGKRMNLSNHPDGYAIGPSLTSAELIETGAEIVIAIEKGGLFTRFVEEQVDKKFKAIIVDTGGQAPRSTRTLLRRLHDELSLPVIILTDGDVYGEHIAMVIKSGSANAAHLRELTVPDAKWVGVWATDIDKYELPTIPMTEADITRCHHLQKDPRYKEGHLEEGARGVPQDKAKGRARGVLKVRPDQHHGQVPPAKTRGRKDDVAGGPRPAASCGRRPRPRLAGVPGYSGRGGPTLSAA